MPVESGAAGIGVGGKIATIILALAAPLLAFALGTQVVPLDKDDPHRDAVRRIIGCFISSFLVAVVGMVLLHRFAPWALPAASEVAVAMGLPGLAGPLSIFWWFLILGALPGWWIVGPFMRWFATRRNKSFGEIVSDGRKVVRGD